MSGFKPTGYGPKQGFHFPASFGFTGSTGAYTTVQPHVRHKPRAFKDGGYVREIVGDQGSAFVRRARPYAEWQREAGATSKLLPQFKDGGKNWIKGAIKHPGAFTKKAKSAGMSTQAYAAKVTKEGSKASATTKRQANLAKTLRGFHKANGGPIMSSGMKGMTTPAGSGLGVLMRMRKRPVRRTLPANTVKEKFAADGGPVGYEKPTYMGAVKDRIKEMLGLAGQSMQSGMAGKAAQKISGRQRQVDRAVEEAVEGKTSASNYSRGGKMRRMGYSKGGKMKRMGYQMGGRPISGYAPMERPVVQARPMMSMPSRPMMARSKGGMTCYAKGGTVEHSDEAQDRPMMKKIAQEVIGDHVRYPAPKGHKGLGKMMK